MSDEAATEGVAIRWVLLALHSRRTKSSRDHSEALRILDIRLSDLKIAAKEPPKSSY